MEQNTVHHDKFISIDERSENSIASTILDIETIFINNFKNGCNYLDEIILKKCKRKLIDAFHANGYYNMALECDMMNLKDNNALTGIGEYPRVFVTFLPQQLKAFNYLVDDSHPINESESQNKATNYKLGVIKKENEELEKVVESLNVLLNKSERHEIIDVRKNNLSDQDGYVIHLDLSNTKKIADLLDKILSFKNDITALNLDELLIAQQFTSEFYVEQKNPYWLNSTINEQKKKSEKIQCDLYSKSVLMISLFNPNYQIPTYSLQIIIDIIIAKLHEELNQFFDEIPENELYLVNNLAFKNDYKTKEDLNISYDSISGSYFFINLKAML